MSLVGYARVSRSEQNLDLQIDALTQAGCQPIFEETESGAKDTRPVLAEALRYARSGDVFVVWRLDRLGRSTAHLLETVRSLGERGIGFRCLQQEIDTTTAVGKLIFHIFAVLAEFERDQLRERTLAGLEARRARGKPLGRPYALTLHDARLAQQLMAGGEPAWRVARRFNVSRSTVYARLRDLQSGAEPA